MRTFLLSLALFVSAIAAAQVPSVTVENVKGEAFKVDVVWASEEEMKAEKKRQEQEVICLISN